MKKYKRWFWNRFPAQFYKTETILPNKNAYKTKKDAIKAYIKSIKEEIASEESYKKIIDNHLNRLYDEWCRITNIKLDLERRK